MGKRPYGAGQRLAREKRVRQMRRLFSQHKQLQFLGKSATIKPIRGIMSLSVTESGGVEKSAQMSVFVAED